MPDTIKAKVKSNKDSGQREIEWTWNERVSLTPSRREDGFARLVLDDKNNFLHTECNCFDFKKTFKKDGPCQHLIALMNKYIWEEDENR